jgi:hypothetical protein
MKSDVLIPIVVIIGCIILIVIYSMSDEDFKEPDIILPANEPKFISDYDNKKDLIISNEDNNNNFPIENIVIEPPQIPTESIAPDAAFKDVDFEKIRDDGVDDAMKISTNKNEDEYKKVIDAALVFEYPKNSGDFLTNINVKDISKEELENSTLADIFNKTTAKVIKHISDDQIKNILGKPIEEKRIVDNLYKPEVVLFDKNLELTNNISNNITYKYAGFDEIPLGSLI